MSISKRFKPSEPSELLVYSALFQVEDSRRTDNRSRVRISAATLSRLFSGAASAGRGYRGDRAGSHYHQWFPEVKEPQQAGMELLMSGEFGQVRNKMRFRCKHLNVSKRVRDRTCHIRGTLFKEDVASVSFNDHHVRNLTSFSVSHS